MEAYPRPAAERRSQGEALAGGTGVRGRYRQLREIARKAFNHPLNGFARVLRNRARGGTGPLLKALVRLKRSRLTQTTFIGITGSCGKSTAVMLAKAILSSSGKCLSPSVGKQTTTMDRAWLFAADAILNTNSTVKFCVLETHAPSPGIIGEMLDLLRPQIGAVTVVGGDHRKNYRSLEATAQEKGLQVECLPAGGFAILNLDDPNVAGMIGRTRAQVLTYGRSAQADLRASEVSSAWPARLSLRIDYRGDSVFVETRLLGEHWIASILAATGIALACGIDLKTCAEIIATFEPAFGRYTVSPRPDGGAFVLDVNKAPFWTIPDGLAFVKAATAPRRTVVFGTISDYSGTAGPRYRQVARAALEVADRVVFVGQHCGHIDKMRKDGLEHRLFGFQTTSQASAFINADEVADELIYVKASIAQHLERLMLARLDNVVCWRERCQRRVACMDCQQYRHPTPLPLGLDRVDETVE